MNKIILGSLLLLVLVNCGSHVTVTKTVADKVERHIQVGRLPVLHHVLVFTDGTEEYVDWKEYDSTKIGDKKEVEELE